MDSVPSFMHLKWNRAHHGKGSIFFPVSDLRHCKLYVSNMHLYCGCIILFTHFKFSEQGEAYEKIYRRVRGGYVAFGWRPFSFNVMSYVQFYWCRLGIYTQIDQLVSALDICLLTTNVNRMRVEMRYTGSSKPRNRFMFYSLKNRLRFGFDH